MTIPLLALLGFALWTVVVLAGTIGVYRWSLILTGRAGFQRFRTPDAEAETPFYRRAMRAHANCIENLPLFTVVVVAVVASGVRVMLLDILACIVLGARVVHSVVHVAFEQTNPILVLRFTFFAIQLVAMVWMGLYVTIELLG